MRVWLRPCLHILVALAVLLAGAGVRVWVPRPHAGALSAATTDWFPCIDHHCGCLSAEMCRSRCCCVKPAPPPKAPPVYACCAHEPADEVPVAAAEPESPDTEPSLWVMQSQGCSGYSALAMSLGAFWHMPGNQPELRPLATPARLHHPSLATPVSPSLSPDPPPPRAC